MTKTTLLAALAAAALLAGCGDDGEATRGPAPPKPIPTAAAPAPVDTPFGTASGDLADRMARERKVLDDASALGPLLNEFWTNELQQVYGLQFDAPDSFVFYRGDQSTSCGGRVGPMPNNAFYCFSDAEEQIAFDLDWFQDYLVSHPGGATTFLILAHEWGHAVQDTWKEAGGTDVWEPANRQELNADCLAGVFLAAQIEGGNVIEEAGDADAIFGWLYDSGSSPWLAESSHGTSEERQTAFSGGFTRGTDYCRTTY